jgi:hypothetical protein
MFGTAAPYLVAISAALFSGLTALTLIYTVSHLDPPQPSSPPRSADQLIAEMKRSNVTMRRNIPQSGK